MEQKIDQAINQSMMPQQNGSQKSTEVSTSTQSELLAPADKLIAVALSTKKIFECSPRELDIHIAQSVNNAFKFVGRRENETLKSEVDFILENLPAELRTYLPGMRAGEIPIAIKRGLLKEFGDYFGINVAELLRFCRAHYESPERSNTVKYSLKEEPVPQLAPGKEKVFNLYKNNLLDALAKMRAGQNFEVNGPSLYDFCTSINLLVYSNKERWEILADAGREVVRDHQLKLSVLVEDYHRKPVKRIVDAVIDSLDNEKPLPNDIAVIVKAKAKYLMLKAFLQEMDMIEVDLAETVENKRTLFNYL